MLFSYCPSIDLSNPVNLVTIPRQYLDTHWTRWHFSRMTSNPDEKRHPIRVVARRTGLSPDTLRAWERRYGAVHPAHSQGRRRLYSNGDIKRLQLLRNATIAGWRIGEIAALPSDDLRRLVREERSGGLSGGAQPSHQGVPATSQHLEACLAAIHSLDGRTLESALERAVVAFSPALLIDQLVAPLMRQIGELWWRGELAPSQEHLASSIVWRILADLTAVLQPGGNAPHLVVTTPLGQRHEIGAVLVAAAAAAEGWHVTYLGAELPAVEIARAAAQRDTRAVGLSIVYPRSDPHLHHELVRLRELLPGQVAMLIGGRAAGAYQKTLDVIGARHLPDVASLRTTLRALAAQPPAAGGGVTV